MMNFQFKRLRYFRGHGVHSPFVYDLVRNVFMRRTLLSDDRVLFAALRGKGVCERRAVQLQNLAFHCGYRSCALNEADADFCILMPELSSAETADLTVRATAAGHTVAVMYPYNNREREKLCRRMVCSHLSTTVDNRAYLLFFNNSLPKQHFRL